MYTATIVALILLILPIWVFGILVIWTAIQVSAVLYVLYVYSEKLQTTQRLRAGADFGAMLVFLAYIAVIATNKYGPDLLAHITAHWTEYLYFIDLVLQSSKTIPSIGLLIQLYELYPHIAALIVRTPEYKAYYEQISILPPNECARFVLNLCDKVIALGQQVQAPGVPEYVHDIATRMHLRLLQLVIENHSNWTSFFDPTYQEYIRRNVRTETLVELADRLSQVLRDNINCRVFDRLNAIELEAINTKYNLLCEMVKNNGTCIVPHKV